MISLTGIRSSRHRCISPPGKIYRDNCPEQLFFTLCDHKNHDRNAFNHIVLSLLFAVSASPALRTLWYSQAPNERRTHPSDNREVYSEIECKAFVTLTISSDCAWRELLPLLCLVRLTLRWTSKGWFNRYNLSARSDGPFTGYDLSG